MNYTFPEIRNIDDVLPHIEGRSEFIVAEREFGTVINYAVAYADTFGSPQIGVKLVRDAKPYFRYDHADLIRRELRGIIFDREGNIMSRPFHKFFNIGEREETQPHILDFSLDHTIMTKMDGSMLRPIMLDGKIRWGTKMGFSEVAVFAEKYLEKHSNYTEFAAWCMSQSLTPIFEYVGPFNKVVLDYEEGMTLLAIRENVSGKYINIHGVI
jgi:RNA ligase